jgi:hypothetical protein
MYSIVAIASSDSSTSALRCQAISLNQSGWAWSSDGGNFRS